MTDDPGPKTEVRPEPYPADMAGRVFISYASRDVGVAEKLCAALEKANLPCWIAPRDVPAGDSYAAAIVQATNTCGMVVLVLSNNSIDSRTFCVRSSGPVQSGGSEQGPQDHARI